MNFKKKFPFFPLLFLFFNQATVAQRCTNWLSIPNESSAFRIGDLDVEGDKITVEATFNRTTQWNGADVYQGDLVTKHSGPMDCNYLLRPGSAEITTSHGYYKTPEICLIQLNKTYHVAMVYDGISLKFYRNGFLMSQTSATGNLFQNDFLTQVGLYYPSVVPESFIGYINEVRIWNVARTQQQIQANMNVALSNPAAQKGLLAYYTFADLVNKQGNANWNGSLVGSAVINTTNTSCAFTPDSCNTIPVTCAVKAGNDTSVCSGSTIGLNATGAAVYNWNPTTGLSDPAIPNPTITVNATTVYILTGTTNTGCTSADTVIINALPNPVILTSNDTVICSGTTVQLNTAGGQQYHWSPAMGLSNNSIANPVAKVTANTRYTVTGTASNGCFARDTVHISVLANPLVTISDDTSICLNSSLQLVASGGTRYQWYPSVNLNNANISNPVTTPSQSTEYFVIVTADNNCSIRDSVNVNVKNAAAFSVTPVSAAICSGSSIALQANGGGIYKWQPADDLSNPLISNPVAKLKGDVNYKVFIKDSYCNYDTMLTVKLIVNTKPIVSITKDGDFSCSKPAVQLNANGGSSYSWTPSAGLNNPNISNPVAYVPASNTFYVSVKSSEGCEEKDSIHVEFNGTGNLNTFQLPTAFTPNNDRLNDCFGIRKWGNVGVIRMEIYNRWGVLMFRGKSYSDCWDGTFKGKPQQTGAFPYIIKVKTACGEVERSGVVMLIR